MTSPADVAAFHAAYDVHPDDRVRFFGAVAEALPDVRTVLYPGSYVDIAASVWFDDVTYVDLDRRTPRFFGQHAAVGELVARKRSAIGRPTEPAPTITFHHADYREPLPVDDESVDLLVSMYAGFISEHCSRSLRPGGHLVTNNSHGDASMATLDPGFALVAVVTSESGHYRVVDHDLDRFLVPKNGAPPTRDELHRTQRGIAYTTPAFAYVFRRD
ncbi:MAG: class I SAM-dependent methyltransferase [Actinomycetota bacterium]